MIQAWQMKIPLELIRYAGANHLCVEIKDKNGTHCIEPYKLQKTQEDQLLLLALEHYTGNYIYFFIEQCGFASNRSVFRIQSDRCFASSRSVRQH